MPESPRSTLTAQRLDLRVYLIKRKGFLFSAQLHRIGNPEVRSQTRATRVEIGWESAFLATLHWHLG